MYPKLLHIYGPFEINSFNLSIGLGLALFIYFANKDPLRKLYISKTDFVNLVIESALAGVIGGRLLHVITEWHTYSHVLEIFYLWNGGLSIIGTIASIAIYASIYLKKRSMPVLPILDLGAIYVPLIHAMARVGCFLAGCCFGTQTNMLWAITYSNPEVAAPLHTPLHPTQLYSSCIFFIIFMVMQFLARKNSFNPGALTMIYLMLASIERIIVDFFRGDRIFYSGDSILGWLSVYQWLALLLFSAAAIGFITIGFLNKKSDSHEYL